MYSLEDRISAFIFLENTFIQAQSHTDCVINILIQEQIVKDERDFNRRMKNPFKKKDIEYWVEEIEHNSVFGELTIFNGKLAIVVFDKLNNFGFRAIKDKSLEIFGDLPIYYLNVANPNRCVVELFG